MPASSRSAFSVSELVLRTAGHLLARSIYRVRAHFTERIPEGGCLLLPNHLTWVDAVVLQVACPRPIRFMVDATIYKLPALNPVFRAVGAIPISSTRAKEGLRAAAELIRQGEIVCIFPEGELSRSGILLRLRRGYELLARQAEAPVVPVWLDQLWGSIFSFAGGRYFFKWPKRIPYPVTVAFGEPIPAREADLSTVRERLLELGEWCYQQRPMLRGHVGEACIRGLKKEPGATAIVDGMDGSMMTRGTLLAAALALSRKLRAECPGRRIAIVLPPGKGGVIANLAVMLAGKVPVNLNFTAGRTSNEAAMRIAQVAHCLTARPVVKRLADFPWPEKTLHIDEIMPGLKSSIGMWRGLVAVMPAAALARLAGVPRTGDHAEAVVLFSSGSTGEPKGIVLSHRNLLGNVSQFALMLNLRRDDAVLACLPFFHSFGCTVTLWYPLIEGLRMITYPNALDVAKNAELIRRHKVTLFCSTPTFLRGFLRKAEREQLASIELLVTGAEKLPAELAAAFHERFGIDVLQGYGLTETSPVVSVNLPEPTAVEGRASKGEGGKPDEISIDGPAMPSTPIQPSSRAGSVGKLAPGIAAQIRDPDTGAPLSMHATGMLWLRGPNIFEGYLDDPQRTADVMRDGWFKTGDLAHFDEDGFLFIDGRLSRFSKIGGEMVPHETIESKIYELLALPKDERCICVMGIPDEAKGEALVLVTSRDLDATDLRAKLSEAGLPNLWIPKKLHRVESIPVLASGKLDLKRCKELALGSP